MNATKMKEVLADRGVDYIDGITDEMVARMDWAAGLEADDLDRIRIALQKYAEEMRRLAATAPDGDAEMMREDAEACEWCAGQVEALP